jgi:hypothetical protein
MTHEVNVYAIVVVATVYIPRVDKCTDRFTTDSQILGHELLTLANVSQQRDAQQPSAQPHLTTIHSGILPGGDFFEGGPFEEALLARCVCVVGGRCPLCDETDETSDGCVLCARAPLQAGGRSWLACRGSTGWLLLPAWSCLRPLLAALRLALAGSRCYPETPSDRPWLRAMVHDGSSGKPTSGTRTHPDLLRWCGW